MRPKRIYVNSKTLQKVTAENHAGHTMRVKAFASKQDVEYTDLSQCARLGSLLSGVRSFTFIVIFLFVDYCLLIGVRVWFFCVGISP